MLISTNKKNNIAKSIALMLALVLAFSCILTACADKTARKDVEDLKATVDTLGKDVESVEGVAGAAVTESALNKALADALAAYLTKEQHDADIAALLADYAKTGDVKKLEEALKNYYTKDEADDKFITEEELNTALKAAVAGLVKESDLPGFIADYLKKPEAKDAIAKLLEDTYVSVEDWNDATAAVLTAFENVNKAMNATKNGVYTVAEFEEYKAIRDAAIGKYIVEGVIDEDQLMMDVLRAISPDEFDYLAQLVKDIEEKVECAADVIKSINAKIDALKTASAGKIDTDDKAALDAIKADLVAFDAKYGFNATLVTATVATNDFVNAFQGAVDTAENLAKKLVVTNGYTSNSDYVDAAKGGLKLADYIAMQQRYDFLDNWATNIDALIVGLVANIGESQTITNAQLLDIKAVMAQVNGDTTAADNTDAKAGFKAANNGIVTPIEGWDTYVYYEWLAGKRIFDDDKIASKADLDAYASANAEKFDSSEMNSDVATIVTNAKKALDALTYASYKSYIEADAARKAVVDTAKKDIDEKLNYYRFDDTVLKAIAALEAAKPAGEQYASVVIIANDAIAAVKAVTPATEGAYPYTAAYNAVVAAKDNGLAAMELKKAKIDAKAEVMAYAEAYLTTLFTGTEKNYNDIVAFVKAGATDTDASIDAAETVAKVAEAVTAAKVAVDKVAYAQALNVYMANVQADIFEIAADAKTFASANAGSNVNYTKIGDLANASVIKVRADGLKAYVLVTGSEDPANDVTTWAAAYAKAKAAVDAEKAAFTAKEEVKAYLDLVRI